MLDFKEQNNIVDTGGRSMNTQQLAEINTQLTSARAQTAEAKARYDRIEEVKHLDVADAAVTDSIKNDVINRLRNQYLDLSTKEATWSARYGRNHLAAVNVRTQMQELKRAISDEVSRIAEGYRSDYEIAKAREESIRSSLSSTIAVSQVNNQAAIALRELESNAKTTATLYDNFLQRYMEATQQQVVPDHGSALDRRGVASFQQHAERPNGPRRFGDVRISPEHRLGVAARHLGSRVPLLRPGRECAQD